jgi:hypothetical protein
LFGAFFWSRIAVETSFFGSIKTKNIQIKLKSPI